MTCRYAQLDIATNPEFLTERNAHKDFLHPAQIVLGTTDKNRQPLVQLYRELFPEVPILAVRPAEAMLIKYGCNCYGAVKVTFFNEIFRLAKAMGMSFDLVREGILGWKRIYADHTKVPGPDGKRGFGGHCFPKDSRALLQEAEHLEVPMAVLRAAVEENDFNRGAAT
jgi:UDPglucose 6-dehydrogenase